MAPVNYTDKNQGRYLRREGAAKEAVLNDKIADHRAQIKVLENQLHTLRCKRAGIAPGDVVIAQGTQGEVEVQVTRINTSFDPPWVGGYKRKKDGTWGTGVFDFYANWRKP